MADETKKLDLAGMKKGKVVANDDPDGRCRVRVEIEGITKGMEVSNMPWFETAQPTGLGGSPYTSQFAVPQVNTSVLVQFTDQTSMYSGIVTHSVNGEHTSPQDQLSLTKDYMIPEPVEVHFTENWSANDVTTDDKGMRVSVLNPNLTEDYPMTHGWVDSALNWVKHNMLKRTSQFVFNNFLAMVTHGNGNTVIRIPKNLRIVVEKDFLLEVKGSKDEIVQNGSYTHVLGKEIKMVEGSSRTEAKKGLKLNGKTIDMN